jgi:hypothetical protein
MTTRGALLLLGAGSLMSIGCSSDGGAAPKCGDGQACDGGVDGGGDGGADGAPTLTCGSVPPCAGDVVGDWTFVEICQSLTKTAAQKASFATMAAQSWCVGQTLVGIEPEVSGSLRFDAAGNYALDLVFGGFLDINFPPDCLAGLSCDDATAGFTSQIAQGTYPMPNVTSISCSGSSSCVCRAAVSRPQYETGTYSVSGSAVTFAAGGTAVTNKSYCVAGGALHILEIATVSASLTEIASDLVAMKP